MATPPEACIHLLFQQHLERNAGDYIPPAVSPAVRPPQAAWREAAPHCQPPPPPPLRTFARFRFVDLFPLFFIFVATLLRRAGSKGIAIRRTKLIMAQTWDQSRLPTNKRESICTDTVYQCSSKSIKISPGELACGGNRRIPFECDFAFHLIKSH